MKFVFFSIFFDRSFIENVILIFFINLFIHRLLADRLLSSKNEEATLVAATVGVRVHDKLEISLDTSGSRRGARHVNEASRFQVSVE